MYKLSQCLAFFYKGNNEDEVDSILLLATHERWICSLSSWKGHHNPRPHKTSTWHNEIYHNDVIWVPCCLSFSRELRDLAWFSWMTYAACTRSPRQSRPRPRLGGVRCCWRSARSSSPVWCPRCSSWSEDSWWNSCASAVGSRHGIYLCGGI